MAITIRNTENESTVVLSNINDLNLCKGNYPDIDLDSPFTLGVPEAVCDLEELMMVVK